MNKIIINPHYCSREEYQALKDYLTNETWDWQEISSGCNEVQLKKRKKKVILKTNSNKTMEINYEKWNAGWLQWGIDLGMITDEAKFELELLKTKYPDWDFQDLAQKVKSGDLKPR